MLVAEDLATAATPPWVDWVGSCVLPELEMIEDQLGDLGSALDAGQVRAGIQHRQTRLRNRTP